MKGHLEFISFVLFDQSTDRNWNKTTDLKHKQYQVQWKPFLVEKLVVVNVSPENVEFDATNSIKTVQRNIRGTFCSIFIRIKHFEMKTWYSKSYL